ncbi:MAG: hypothetical protein NT007_03285 [Candidatus Kapabacteria bacterium]|nr:hypothetical protein [Candidatus Kapabacteria bacterium]
MMITLVRSYYRFFALGAVIQINGLWVLRHIVEKIQLKHPGLKIILRGDCGFSYPEFYYQIKLLISRTSNDEAKKWQIDNIRLYLMKVGATITINAKSISVNFSKVFICKDLFVELVELCC